MNPKSQYAINLVTYRLVSEEAFRQYVYDDATGTRVKAPTGNLTWLYGLNLDTAGSPLLGRMVLKFWLVQLHLELMKLAWYVALNAVRQSVILDVAYNDGLDGLLGFKLMIAALAATPPDYAAAMAQLKDSKAATKLPGRYAVLEQLLLSGIVA